MLIEYVYAGKHGAFHEHAQKAIADGLPQAECSELIARFRDMSAEFGLMAVYMDGRLAYSFGDLAKEDRDYTYSEHGLA